MKNPMRDLTLKEKEEILMKVMRFYCDNEHYVTKMIMADIKVSPPNPLTLFNPDLWSGSNWRWYFSGVLE